MFTRPDTLDDTAVVGTLAARWGVEVDSIEYQPVGFGSHHWMGSRASQRWFVTVDDLDMRLVDRLDDRAAARQRLDAALRTARRLHDDGHRWVVAPIASRTGTLIEAIDERFVCALYPFVDGRASSSGHYTEADERRAVVELLAELHRASGDRDVPAIVDDHRIPRRDSLETALRDVDAAWDCGPYADPTRLLLARHGRALISVLDRYAELAETVRGRATPVVTHGEPHRANVIITATGPAMIDWDTTLLAPPERDLWSLIDQDGSIRALYEQRAGRTLDDDALTLYRLWWDLCEIALYVHDFRQPHRRSTDAATAWDELVVHLDPSRWTDVVDQA